MQPVVTGLAHRSQVGWSILTASNSRYDVVDLKPGTRTASLTTTTIAPNDMGPQLRQRRVDPPLDASAMRDLPI